MITRVLNRLPEALKTNADFIKKIIIKNSDIVQTTRGEVLSLRPLKVISYMDEIRLIAQKMVGAQRYLQCDPRIKEVTVQFKNGQSQKVMCSKSEWVLIHGGEFVKGFSIN